MTWVKDSDDVYDDEALREADKDAALLWSVAMRECAKRDGDGVVTPLMIQDSLNKFPTAIKRAAVATLVAQGLWHDEDGLAGCGTCRERTPALPSPRHRLIHDWNAHLLLAAGKDDPIVRKREQRRKALNGPRCLQLRQDVRERDMDLCRYCGVETLDPSGPDKKSARIRTLDHVDPWGDNTRENVVVACRRCNGRKRDRSPEQAGMLLLDPGTTKAMLAGRPPDNPAQDPAQPPEDPALVPAVPRDARETGTGRIGTGHTGLGSGPAPERDPAHATNGHTNGAH